MNESKVAVVGSTGFVGRAVVADLRAAGVEVVEVSGPRLAPVSAHAAGVVAADHASVLSVAQSLAGCAAVINAAGNPDASSRDEDALNAANGALPGLIGSAAASLDASPRFVHVSSAVVQGRADRLDDSPARDGFSSYARSKALGEALALELGPTETVVYRPPSVHAPDRRVSIAIGRIARSPFSVVASPGTQPTPQALLANVASAVSFLATTPQRPPRIVAHPSEGLTTSGLLEALGGGRRPRKVPRVLARAGTGLLAQAGKAVPGLAANARRVEMILFGQQQSKSWLSDAGWMPPQGQEAWRELGDVLGTNEARR